MATARQIRNRGRFSLVLGALVATILFAAVAYADPDPTPACVQTGVETVATDKGDYSPEEVVHVTGAGYAASCAVVVRVTRPDGSVVVGDGSFAPGSDTVTTGAGGELAYDYQLDGIVGEYLVEALGAGDVVLASTTFTDALSLGQDNVDLSPAFTVKPTAATSATGAYSLLVQQDSPDTAIRCIRIGLPAGWTLNSAALSNVSAGTWSSSASGNVVKFTSLGGLPGGSPGFARIEFNATTTAADGQSDNAWLVQVSDSATNTNAAQACAGTVNNQGIASVWDDAWPFGLARIYTVTFRDAGGAVTAPIATIGVSTTYRVRVAMPGTSAVPDDAMSYATIALPPCFTAISLVSTTVSAPVAKTWTGSVVDNMIRLRSNGPPNELKDSGVADEYVQVEFTATAPVACAVGSSVWSTSTWGGPNSATSSPFVRRTFGITNSQPTITIRPNATVSTTIHDAGHAAVTAVPRGTTVHDFVRVTGPSGTPTGTVTIDWFLNGTCTGSPSVTSGPFALDASGQVDATGFSFTVNSAGKRAFLAHYSGDSTYSAANGRCEELTVVDANIQISPNTDANPVGATHVFTGHVNVNDGNGFANAPDGTQISFTIDSGPGTLGTPNPCTTSGGTGNCTITLTSATTGTTTVSAHTTVVVGGVALTRDTDGMNGNSRPATKHWADDTVTTVVRDAAGNDVTNTTVAGGVTVHDEATVTRTPGTPAPVPNPTGTVDFTLYDNGTCDGNMVMSDPNKPLNASGTATSANFVTPAAIATFSYRAHYDGDANYPAHDGPCEPFNVDGIPPVTTITLDPANPDACCWYVFPVKVTVSATDVGTGVAETRCVLDPATPPATFDDLPPGMCPYLMPSWVVTDGIHTICAASRDNAGNKETPVCKTFKIDRTPPTSQIGPPALPQFQPNPGAFTVNWSGSDNLSGIKDFDVRYRTAPAGGSFGGYTQWFTDTTLTSALFTPTPGSTICFSVRARDKACWEQPTYSPEQCTTAPYDDPSLTRTGYWTTVSGSGYFGPGVSRSTSSGNKLTLAGLRGSVIGVLATKQPGGGTIELRWNGSTKLTTSLSAGSVQKKQLLTFTLSSVQNGTLDIVQTGSGTVEVDAAGAYKDS